MAASAHTLNSSPPPGGRLDGCPRCGYARLTDVGPVRRCPECGLELAAGSLRLGRHARGEVEIGSRGTWAVAVGLPVVMLAIGGVAAGAILPVLVFSLVGVLVALVVAGLFHLRAKVGVPRDRHGGRCIVLGPSGVTAWKAGSAEPTVPWDRYRRWTWTGGPVGPRLPPGVVRRMLRLQGRFPLSTHQLLELTTDDARRLVACLRRHHPAAEGGGTLDGDAEAEVDARSRDAGSHAAAAARRRRRP